MTRQWRIEFEGAYSMRWSLQSNQPHCEHTVAGTSLTTTTPNPKSTVKEFRLVIRVIAGYLNYL